LDAPAASLKSARRLSGRARAILDDRLAEAARKEGFELVEAGDD
jgi:hypothetical protein